MDGAIDALRADREALLEICDGLSDDQWAAPSGCAGWSVQDVVAHMAALFTVVVDPSSLPDADGAATEQTPGDLRRGRAARGAPTRSLDDYRSVSPNAIDRLADLATQTFELPLGDLGTYPASALANAFAFDHYIHIRADLFAPAGPLTGPVPPSDELRAGAGARVGPGRVAPAERRRHRVAGRRGPARAHRAGRPAPRDR